MKLRYASIGPVAIGLLTILFTPTTFAQQAANPPANEPDHPAPISLWPNGAPGSEQFKDQKETVVQMGQGRGSFIAVSNVHNPTITVYLPSTEKATGAAVIVAPGGAHRFLAISHEGYFVGQWLADHGIAAFVLKYRLENGSTPESGAKYSKTKESLADAQRSIRTVRSRADEWHVKPDAVGIMGFSAGGQVAALAAMNYDNGQADAADPIDRLNSKPAFQGLIYAGAAETITPDKNSPPAFIACAFDDNVRISEGLADAYLRFHKAGVNAELHIFSSGGHGFGIRQNDTRIPVHEWQDRFAEWVTERKFASK